jgi:predicted dehydrogenase
MKEKIGIGFIGTGFTRVTQIPAFQNCPEAELVSVASGNPANAEKTANDFGIRHHTGDWRETVSHDDVDLVCITTPPNLHREMTLFCAEQGKHILCEKPMAMNASEALEMAEAAESASVMALIDHELRFLNGRKKAYRILREGEIGEIIHAKTIFRNASRGNPDLKWNWWSDAEAGGGALGAIGSHAIDGLHWFLGSEITDIFCLLKTNVKERRDAAGIVHPVTSDDEANFIVKFADSDIAKNASGTGSFSMVETGEYDFWTELYGTEGSMVIGESGQLKLAKKGDDKWVPLEFDLGEAPPDTRVGGWSRGFMALAREMIAALLEGKIEVESAATFRDGWKIQKVLDAARESDTTGKMICV